MHFILALVASGTLLASPGEVRVFAAASLQRVFSAAATQIGEAPRLAFNFAGSQQLALQLSQGADGDVFASADERWMLDAEKHGLLAAPPRVFARNQLVVITPAGNPGKVDRLADLARPGVKVVLAADVVPAGRYSRQALLKLGTAGGLGDEYAAGVLANVVSEEENVEAVATKVQLGEADAGIVYVSDLSPQRRAAVRSLEIPAAANVVAAYYIAPLKSAADPAGARAFIAWLASDAGRRLIAEHGFLPGD
jgi:molybdate transport system substrate-binding protein